MITTLLKMAKKKFAFFKIIQHPDANKALI